MTHQPTIQPPVRPPELPTFGGRRNLRQEIAAALRGSIVAGELQPGELYSVPGLAERIEVPTVRDIAAAVGAGRLAPAAVDDLRPQSVAIEEYAATGDLVAYVEARKTSPSLPY